MKLKIILFCVLMFFFGVNVEFIEIDWKVGGDVLVIFYEEIGLEWFDFIQIDGVLID